MALYGLRVRDANGNVTLDIIDRITRLRYSTIADAHINGSVELPDIEGKSSCQFGIALETYKYAHHVKRIGNTIQWTYRTVVDYYPQGYTDSSKTFIVVFLYD